MSRPTDENQDLWSGHGISPTNWPDIQKGLQIVQDELATALEMQELWRLERANRWAQALAEALNSETQRVKKEME